MNERTPQHGAAGAQPDARPDAETIAMAAVESDAPADDSPADGSPARRSRRAGEADWFSFLYPGAEHGGLALGATPRADLMPPDLREAQQLHGLRARWRLGFLVALLAVVCLAGSALLQQQSASAGLDDARARSQQLLGEQAGYGEVGQTQSLAASRAEAKRIAQSKDLDWRELLGELRASLPAGVRITALTADSESPLHAYESPVNPLEATRAGTVTASVAAENLGALADWLRALRGFAGYADAAVTSASSGDGGLNAEVTLHFTVDRFDTTQDDQENTP